MPTNEEKLDTLVAIGISSNQKSGKIENKTNKKLTFWKAQNIASENMIIQLMDTPHLILKIMLKIN